MKLKLSDLTPDEKFIIAEYIYSFEGDFLIKSDAENVLNLFKKRGIDVSTIELEANSVMNLIRTHLERPDIEVMMRDYFNSSLEELLCLQKKYLPGQ